MTKKNRLLTTILWIAGLIVTLVIGFAMIKGTLVLPTWLGGLIVSQVAGWILLIVTAIGAISEFLSVFKIK